MHIASITREQTLGKILGYLFWKFVLRRFGGFQAWLDQYFWGPSRGLNEYNDLEMYKDSHVKPDKKYSMLPTVINLLHGYEGKEVVDLGCGTGFYSLPFAEKAKRVYSLDNSETQLNLATRHRNVDYQLRDIFTDKLPSGDFFIASYVTNYAPTISVLRNFFQRIYESLSSDGKLVLIVDLPNKRELKNFGATKKLLGEAVDETPLEITLYNKGEEICTLQAVYFKPETIYRILCETGFQDIIWHKPIVSDEGITHLGKDFWSGYLEDPELGYLTAIKKPAR